MFEILAKSEPGGPVWYYGHNEALEEGWISDAVVACEGPEPDNIWTRAAPQLPEPEPQPDDQPDESPVCHAKLEQEECKAAGGTWIVVLKVPNGSYCQCP